MNKLYIRELIFDAINDWSKQDLEASLLPSQITDLTEWVWAEIKEEI